LSCTLTIFSSGNTIVDVFIDQIRYLSSSFIGDVLTTRIGMYDRLGNDLASLDLNIVPGNEIAIAGNVLRYEFLIQE
jgi:hypothetical protein